MTEQLPDITIGNDDADANPFGRDLPKEEQPPSLLDRAVDTAKANFYENTLAGSAIAWGQHAYDLAVINAEKGADSGKNLTSAQIASIRNKAYPEATTFGERAADIIGGFAGMAASPENFILPGVRASEAVIKGGQAASKLFPKVGAAVENMPGIAQRMIDTGAGQSVVTALTNPVIQNNRIQAGLQREFDGWEMGLAPIEGFAMGAALHGAFEGAGQVAKAGFNKLMGSSSGQAMQAGFEDRLRQTMMDRIKENDPGFRSADEVTPPSPVAPRETPVTGDVSVMPEPSAGAPSVPVEPAPLPPAVQAAADASNAIREAESTGNLASIPQATGAAAAAPNAEGGPAGVFMFDPTTLKVDAKRFQFKEGGDDQGVTTALKGVTKWDRAKGNQVIVWQDKGGDFYVVDGHQRSGLARRLIEGGKEKNIELPGLLYREADGVTAADARAIAAVKNIAEGSGSALDGAKVLRSRPDLMDGSLPLSAGKGRQAAALAKLDDEAFRMVVNDVIGEHYGAIVGERIPNDPERQIAAIKAIAKFSPSNETEAATLVQRVAQAELEKRADAAQGSMFGDLEAADSTAGSEMKIVGRAIKELQKDKTLFRRVVANASRIEETGSNIERQSAKAVTTEAELFARKLASDAYTPGPLREALKAAARDYQNGQIEIGEASARILSALRRAAEDDGAARAGNRGGGEQAASTGEAAGKPISGPGASERPVGAAERRVVPAGRIEQRDVPNVVPAGRVNKFYKNIRGFDENAPEWFKQVEGAIHALSAKIGLPVKPRLWVGEPIDAKANTLSGIARMDGHIIVTRGLTGEQALINSLHELGHLVEAQMLKNAPPDVQLAIENAWRDHRRKFKNSKTYEQHRPLGSRRFDEATQKAPVRGSQEDAAKVAGATKFMKADAIMDFHEWFAEQVSRWLSQTTAPQTIVEKFFAGVAEKWRQIYERVTGHIPLTKEVDDFMRQNWRGSLVEQARKEIKAGKRGELGGGEVEPTTTFEPGAEGKPQSVIPGAERASDKTMAQRRAEAPMHGGNEPAGGMFDEANTNQGDLQFRRGAPNYPPEVARDIVERRGQIIQSLQRQSFDLADLIGIPLRAGRVEQQALGQFEKKFGVARARNVGDFVTVAHEAGHAIENKFGQDVTNIIIRNAAELSPLDPNGTNSANEGFAEWVSNYLTNKAFAVRQAPQTAAEFTRFLQSRDPGLLEGLDRAAENFNAYITASSGERINATIVPMEKQGWFADLKRSYKEAGLATTIGRVLADSYTAIFDSYAPLNRAVRDLARMARDRSGNLVDLRAADNPEVLTRMWLGRAAQGAYHQMRYGVMPYREVAPRGPSLHDAIALATGEPGLLGKWNGPKVEQFSEYLTAKRANVLWDKYAAGEIPNPPTPFSQADARAHMAALEADNPNFAQASQLVHEYTRQLLKKQLDAGLIKKELYDQLLKETFYVPMFRDVSDKPMATAGGGGSSAEGPGQTQTIRALKGSSRDIIDPLQGLMQQTFLVERTIRHNDVIQSLVNLAERAGSPSGYLVEPLKAHEVKRLSVDLDEQLRSLARQKGVSPLDTQVMMSSVLNTFNNDPLNATIFWKEPTSPRGEPIAFYKDAGELKAVRFMAGQEGLALYESVMGLPAIGQDLFNATLAFAGNLQRAGIVLNPTFMLANGIRDQLAVGILRPDYVPFWDGAKGVWSEATQNEAAQLYGYFGGQSAGAYVNEPSARSKAIDVGAIGKKGYVAQHSRSLMDLAETVQITESGTRNSVFAKVYEQKLSQGLSPYEAAMEAAWAGTDVLDFSRHGSKTYAVRQIIPFLNAHLQGLDKARRTMLEPLARAAKGDILTVEEKQQVANAYLAMSKFAVAGAALGAIWAAINSEDEIYLDADPQRKATHFIFSAGGKEIDIPKPFELSLGFSAGEEAFRRFVLRDPRGAGSLITAAWDVLAPPNPLLNSPLVKLAFEQATGVDTYTRRDIVPEALQNLPENMQKTERTSPLAVGISDASKTISDFLNAATNKEFAGLVGFDKPWSPIKVEHMFGSAFGTTGRDMMAAAHWLAPGDEITGAGLENSMILRRFIKDPTRSSDTVKRYYEHVGEKTGDYDKAKDGYNFAIKAGNLTDAQSIYRNLDESKKAYVVLNSGGDEEGNPVFSGDDKKAHPMSRARLAVQQLNAVARELSAGSINDSETGGAIGLPKPMRKSAIEAIHQLGAQEMRNALVMTDEPGYAGRKLLDIKKQYAVIKAISPSLAQEVARRYAMAKVFTTEAVAAEWQGIKRELVRGGSQADIADRVSNISAAGFEFGGEHMPRKKLKRAPMLGEATP